MSYNQKLNRGIVAAALIAGLGAPQLLHAQNGRPQDRYDGDRYADRYDRNGKYDAYTRLSEIDAGTFITIRTRGSIDSNRRDGRVYPVTVENDVWDDYKRLAVPVIRRGSAAELLVRTAQDGDLILDLDTVVVGGKRYSVSSSPARVDAGGRGNDRDNVAGYVGGGAVLGTIIGAIAGGGKGAAIGAVAGAAGGAVLMTQGRNIRVPAGSVVTFRLDHPLTVATATRRR